MSSIDNVRRAKLNAWLYQTREGAMFSSLNLKHSPLRVGFHHERHGQLPDRKYVAGTTDYLFYIRKPK